jgi:hypothetical protein
MDSDTLTCTSIIVSQKPTAMSYNMLGFDGEDVTQPRKGEGKKEHKKRRRLLKVIGQALLIH